MDKKDNPMSRLMELAAPYKGEYVLSVILAILGVAAGLLPFFAVSKIVILLMDRLADRTDDFVRDSAFYMVHRPVTEKIGNGFATKTAGPGGPRF